MVANPSARWLRRRPRRLDALRGRLGGRGRLHAPETREGVVAAVEAARADQPAVIAILGGDGTVHHVLSALLADAEAELPDVVLLPGGTMNTVARSLGVRGGVLEALDAVLDEVGGGARCARVRRAPLRVDDRHHGFLFGVGLVPRFIEVYESGGEPSPVKAARTLARAVGSAFVGGAFAQRFFAPVEVRVQLDDVVWPPTRWRLVTAGAGHDLGLGFRPFPGLLERTGVLGAFGTASTPTRFARDLWPIWRGRPVRHAEACGGVGRVLRLEAAAPLAYNLDGDLYVARGPTLEVRAGREVRFVLPPGGRPPAGAAAGPLSGS